MQPFKQTIRSVEDLEEIMGTPSTPLLKSVYIFSLFS